MRSSARQPIPELEIRQAATHRYSRHVFRRDGEDMRLPDPAKRTAARAGIGIIADLLVSPVEPGLIDSLIAYAVCISGKLGHGDSGRLQLKPIQDSLARHGFLKTEEETPMFHAQADRPEFRKALEPGRWLLGKSDHDWDQYPLAK